GLGQETVEEDGVGQVADLRILLAVVHKVQDDGTYNEHKVEPPTDVLHGNTGDLPDHGVQAE
nr:hypothetical protein [Tanacetum cinerariifolium]